ncbi:MT-A70 family methyltransferase [Mesorhizobium sp. RMAD-H1]|uniref:MT-A70 family methyltransferase n=1 Tax=Mesorhizobium sp. RMAD-H1 TaxID=2587065 RepID=UPI00160CF60C|nr:MT-A70 family methyltransferase [Mesorhizobium sp. RMAD-H1]MBB2973971.1 N6-adenosine-specific RNA methylase IME4 [Mesorhizobium sp. RMAD-H1]
MSYPPHPLAELFPMIPEADRRLLADDIVTFGQRDPIILLDGMVLDGRNRQWACAFAQIEPVYEEYAGDDPLNFVLSKNLHRRHLTESQRALIAASIVDWERGLNQNTAGSANLQTRRAAEKLSISERAVESAKRIHEKGAPELIEAIRSGKVSVHAGEALSELQHAEQARVVRAEKKAIVAKAKEIRAEQQQVRHAVRLTTMQLVADKGRETAPGKIERLYPIIYADPPWQFGVRSEVTGREKSAENHYPTMPTDEICGLLARIGSPIMDDGVLFLWATNPMLPQALRVMQAWGFTYVHHWIWDKEVAGTGYWGRDRHEMLLIGKRGNPPAPLPGTQPETVYRERKGKHSAKPAFFAEQIERLYPGVPKLELFCRSPCPGWDAWGYEAQGGEGAASATPLSQAEVFDLACLANIRDGMPFEGPALDGAIALGYVAGDPPALTDAGNAHLADLERRVRG